MEKRKLSALPRPEATAEMVEMADRLDGMEHIVTAELVDDNKILLLNFYEVSKLKKGKTEAAFRTFLSSDDYITQDLSQSKVKWLTAAFDNMQGFRLWEYKWDQKTWKSEHIPKVFIWTAEDKSIMESFFKAYRKDTDENVWNAIDRFQDKVKAERLAEKHRKVLAPIDLRMEPIGEPSQDFTDWVWEQGMSFSRYGIYKETSKGKAEFECTHCQKTGIVDRSRIRLRNNEKGECPFCGSRVTYKARGKMPCQISDERWFIYVDRQEEGFLLRYFKAWRHIKNDAMIAGCICKKRIEETMHEYSRCFCTFFGEKLMKESYEWGVYHQKGNLRWIPDEGNIACMECILYPGNLPEAWEHTPMKYSALEILAQNIPTTAFRYEDAIDVYLKFPKLEWFCKMGLNQLAKDVVRGYNYSGNMTGKVNYKADTIYEILGLNKVNTRTLQAIDGNHYELRLLQVAQQLDIQMKPEQLKEFYETFECNTDLLKEKNRRVSLHKLCRYIDKESKRYPIGEKNACMWGYSYNRYKERTDPRIERKQNMAHDWLEYIGWCRELKYDLDNKFIYMPNNFKKVHDRVAGEYKALQDKKAAAEKLRREKLAAKRMEQTKKAMEEIFSKNDGVDAFQIKGKGLILVVPQSGDEIRKEGEALDHCVGGYVERVAKGETNIFFVRKADHPEQSYFTMEWKNNKVVQCRGKSNCGMPPDVKAFVQVFEKKMQDAIQKGDTNGKKKQNLQSA